MKAFPEKTVAALAISLSLSAQANPDLNREVVQYPVIQQTNTAGRIIDIARFVVDQLAQNREIKNLKDSKIAVASIVDVESNLQHTDRLGVLLPELIMHELHVRGFNVIDFKMMPGIKIGNPGDFILSRSLDEIRSKYDIHYVVFGTYAKYQDGQMIQIRAVNLKTAQVASSAEAFVPKRLLNNINNQYEVVTRLEPVYVAPPVEPYSMPLIKGNCLTVDDCGVLKKGACLTANNCSAFTNAK